MWRSAFIRALSTGIRPSLSNSDEWAPVLLLNPVSPLLEGLSDAIIMHRAPDPFWLLYSLACTAILLVGALAVFRSAEPYFAESV